MLNRVYAVVGSLVLAGYGLSSFAGWEFGNPTRDRVPVLVAGSYRPTSWWGRTYWGTGHGGK
jgi:hypothetical protein